jgi:hypothetical protein
VGVYLANLKQVRGLTETANELQEEILQGELDETEPIAPRG